MFHFILLVILMIYQNLILLFVCEIFHLNCKTENLKNKKAINSVREQFCLNISLFTHFLQFQISEQTVFNFLILWKSRFHPKKFYNIDYLMLCFEFKVLACT